MMEGELQRGSGERNAVAATDLVDPAHRVHHRSGRRMVIIRRAGAPPGRQDAGIERPADDDSDVPPDAERQKTVERRLLEKRIAAGEEDAVEIARLGETLTRRPLVKADADRADRLVLAQAQERAVAARHHLRKALVHRRLALMRPNVDVVDVNDVDPCKTQALQTVGDRAQDPLIGIVVLRGEGEDVAKQPTIGRRLRMQQPSDFGREHEAVSLVVTQHGTDAMLAESVAVERRRVEEIDAGAERTLDGTRRIRLGQLGEEIAERRAAEAELADAQRGASERPRLGGSHPMTCGEISPRRSSILRRTGIAAIAPCAVQASAPAMTPQRAASTMSPVSARRVANTPLKASPAPVVSRMSTRGAGTRVIAPDGSATSTPAPPRVITTAQPCWRISARASAAGSSSAVPPARRAASSRLGVRISRQRHSASGTVVSAGAGLRMVVAVAALAMRKAARVAATDTSSWPSTICAASIRSRATAMSVPSSTAFAPETMTI